VANTKATDLSNLIDTVNRQRYSVFVQVTSIYSRLYMCRFLQLTVMGVCDYKFYVDDG